MENSEGIINFLKGYFETDKCATAYKIIIIVAVVVFFYSNVLNHKFGEERSSNDPMNKTIGNSKFGVWAISHFITYFVLGFMFPYCFRGIITIGIVWEIMESIGGYYSKKSKNLSKKDSTQQQYGKSWWKGTVEDIFINMAGFVCGALISVYVFHNKKCS